MTQAHYQQGFGFFRARLWAVPSPHGLDDRIRRARQDLDLTQAALARAVGVDIRTVQGWESGRRPRGRAARDLERVLSIDLSAEPESPSPRLDEATDAQVIANLASRLADRDRTIRELRERLEGVHAQAPTSNLAAVATGRWAARTREDPDDTEQPGRVND